MARVRLNASPMVSSFAPAELDPLPREFFLQPTAPLARALLGRFLVRKLPNGEKMVARLVETEAYVGEHDQASHSSHGHTARTAPMFEQGGLAYVYFVYGMYWCLNVVTEGFGKGCAVLLRGAEPLTGIDGRMDGPGRLCRAMGIDGTWNRADLTSSDLLITCGLPVPEAAVSTSPRIGVGYAGVWANEPLRYYVASSPHVSRPSRRPGGDPAKRRSQ